MIRNILTHIFSGESAPASENQTASQTTTPAGPSFGISSIRDSFESTASKGSPLFDLGLVPNKQDLEDASKTQEQLLKEKQKISEEQKKFEEMTNDRGSFGNEIGSLFGDDKGTLIDYQSQTAVNTYNEAEKSSQHISETVDTSDDFKKYSG